MLASTALLALVGTASAGSLLWDGRANDYKTAAFLDKWSWSNQVGPYQWYIHGSGTTNDYVALSAESKNPADTGSNQGIQMTIDKTSSWNGQTMLRTELIPQTSAAINKGKVFYHFSLKHTGTNIPTPTEEHQVCFFESHFTEMKFGSSGGSSKLLSWYAGSQPHWNVTFEAGVWHNIAYGIDFDAQTVEFYHSTGAKDLTLTAGPVSASTESNGADWHLGVLRLPSGSGEAVAEDWNFSGVYIEKGDITKSVSGPGGKSASRETAAKAATPTSAKGATSAKPTSSTPTTFQTKVKPSSPIATAATDAPGAYTSPQSSTSATESSLPTETAVNLAPTFSTTASISLTYTAPSTLSTWYPETADASTLFAKPSSEAVASNPAAVFTVPAATSTGC